MKKVNSLSGGKTSSYMAVHHPADYDVFSLVCIEDEASRPKDKLVVQYVNDKLAKFTGQYGEFIATAEDDMTLTAMMDLEQLIGREITWVRGISFDKLIDEGTQTRLPSWARRYCTSKMKLLPIFMWWFNNLYEKCEMRIGFRFDEFDRMIRFFNNQLVGNFSIPTSCKNYGNKRHVNEEFNWRHVTFPLIKEAITSEVVNDYWNTKGYVGGDLFNPLKKIEFPAISNCVGCFHKSPEIIAAMAELNPTKIQWFANQESKEMGTWLENKLTYQEIMDRRLEISKEVLYEIKQTGTTCDTAECSN